jgi:hypothetical protein
MALVFFQNFKNLNFNRLVFKKPEKRARSVLKLIFLPRILSTLYSQELRFPAVITDYKKSAFLHGICSPKPPKLGAPNPHSLSLTRRRRTLWPPATMAAAAAEEGPGASFNAQEDALLRVLAARGWRFRDPIEEAVQALFYSSPSPSPEAVESEIVDLDLRTLGGKSLPDRATTAATAKRLSYLHGPIVLQVPLLVFVRVKCLIY